MFRRIGSQLRHQWIGSVALFLVVAGGTAYAAATIGSPEIINNSVASADLRNEDIRTQDIRDDSLPGGGLTGADVNEATLNVVQGRGTLLSNRLVLGPSSPSTPAVPLLQIPGLGRLDLYCLSQGGALVEFVNTTTANVDLWHMMLTEDGPADAMDRWQVGLKAPGSRTVVAYSNYDGIDPHGTEISVGQGNSPGPRKVATLNVFAFQEQNGFPCGFQAQGTLWTTN